jgi:transcriptional regulator with XRE-family HTH domain
MVTTGEKIKQLRKELGLTQEELGQMIGVQKAAINKYETGLVVNLKKSTISALAKALHVSPVELLSPGKPPDNQPQTSEAQILAKGIDKMPKEQREQALNIIKAVFAQYADYFNKENDDET